LIHWKPSRDSRFEVPENHFGHDTISALTSKANADGKAGNHHDPRLADSRLVQSYWRLAPTHQPINVVMKSLSTTSLLARHALTRAAGLLSTDPLGTIAGFPI